MSRGPCCSTLLKRGFFLTLLLLAGSLLAQQQGSSSSGSAADLAQLYTQGMAAFQAGDYAKAAADLDGMLTKAEFSPQLEPAFFTVGSAYFNVLDYKKAIAAFKTYQSTFPNGPHAGEVAYAIG